MLMTDLVKDAFLGRFLRDRQLGRDSRMYAAASNAIGAMDTSNQYLDRNSTITPEQVGRDYLAKTPAFDAKASMYGAATAKLPAADMAALNGILGKLNTADQEKVRSAIGTGRTTAQDFVSKYNARYAAPAPVAAKPAPVAPKPAAPAIPPVSSDEFKSRMTSSGWNMKPGEFAKPVVAKPSVRPRGIV